MKLITEKPKKKSKVKKNKHKSEFGKTMYLFNVIFVSYVVTISFILIALSGKLGIIDLSAISTIVMSAFAELGIHTGFIVWKAKVENCRKYPNVNQTNISLQNLGDFSVQNSINSTENDMNNTQNTEYNPQNNRGT